MQESLSSEHSAELVSNSLEQFLNGGGVTDESGRHVQVSWWNRANGGLHVVWNPLDKVVCVSGLDLEHFVVNFLYGDVTSEESSNSQVTTVSWVGGSHHVLSVEHLLGQFWNSQRSERFGADRRQWSVTNHKEVQSWERNQVDGQLSQVGVQLTRVTQRGGDTRHDARHQVVQLVVIWLRQLQGFLANVVQCLVIDTEGLIGVLHQLVDRQGGIVWLDNRVGHLWRRHHREGGHHSVGKLFSNSGNQQSTHTRTGTTTQRMGDLETLQRVAALGLSSHNFHDGVHQLCTLGVVTFGPDVSGGRLAKNIVIRTEQVSNP